MTMQGRYAARMLAAWLVLVAAALVTGWQGWRLLQREGERLAVVAEKALAIEADAVAAGMISAVRGVEEELSRRLQAVPPADAQRLLPQWPDQNPLVRNTFVWRMSDRKLLWPAAAGTPTSEERSFINRYSRLFSGEAAWSSLLRPAGERQVPPTSSLPGSLRTLAREVPSSKGSRTAAAGDATLDHWFPWFEGERLFLLGWIERDGLVYGIELETVALLARLTDGLPRNANPDRLWTLLDGNGRIMLASGDSGMAENRKPSKTVDLNPVLPHWQVAIFIKLGASPAAAGAGFRIMGTLLLGILMIAIVAGGGILLHAARREAREAMRKTTFVANVSHELKTPLTTIRMYAEMLGEGRVGDEEKRRQYLQVIIAEGQRLTRLVNNMLDFSRMEQARKKYTVETVDLAAWLRGVVESHTPRATEAGMTLTTDIPAEPCSAVRADRDALEQAVLNLLDNAIKYAAAGREIAIVVRTTGNVVQLDVCDRGPGVPPALREKIFETFFRADDSLTARVPGSGLGLSIARRLMRDTGGDLVCRPRDGGGTIFRLTIPIA